MWKAYAAAWVSTSAAVIAGMDNIWQCISGMDRYQKPGRLNAVAFGLRDYLLDCVRTRRGRWQKSRIMLFQYCHNLDTKDSILVDGIMGPETDAAMKNTKLQKGYVGYLASFVEIALMSWGYDPKGVEWAGEIGDGCNNAGMQFQKDRGYYGGKEVIFGYTTIKDLLS